MSFVRLKKAWLSSFDRGRRALRYFIIFSPSLIKKKEIISVIAETARENCIMSFLAKKYDLKTPGRGSIFSHQLDFLAKHDEYQINTATPQSESSQESFFPRLMGIICVLQRGEGDKVARISLNYGASVPSTTHGEGSGVRDKLGLLRITIPPEKELVNLIFSEHDASAVMELFIEAGKLDEPGRGIAYAFPIKQGIINTKVSRSRMAQAASIEQLVSAIDNMQGGMEWRKSSLEMGAAKRREFLYDMTELNLICREGFGTALTEAAMHSGAPGATICKMRYLKTTDNGERRRFVRELCKMIVPKNQVEAITAGLEATGCFEDDAFAMLYALPVEKAYTYRAKAIKNSG